MCVNTTAKIDDLNELLVQINIKQNVVVITETKLYISQTCNISMKGYHFIHKYTLKNFGGAGLFTKD